MNKQIQNVVTEMIDGINYQQMIGGEIFLNLKDVAIGLGFERERERNGNITKTIRWDNIKKYLSEIDDRYLTQEVGLDLFILESDFYELAMVAKSETAKAFRKKIAKEILPAIRKHGAYISEIAGLKEKQCGKYSGWKYKVNGVVPGVACSSYELHENDVIEWYYAANYSD